MKEENNSTAVETISATLRIGNEMVQIEARFSTGVIEADELIPLFQDLTNKIVENSVREVEAGGKHISCHSGCGACCSQLVPISIPEGIYLLNLIKSLPKERQDILRQRFSDNIDVLRSKELLDAIVNSDTKDTRRKAGIQYFKSHIPCPFLEDQSCSIHPYRPLSCREFLVTSDPEHCAQLNLEATEVVVLPRRISSLVYSLDGAAASKKQFIPLVLLLEQEDTIRESMPPPFEAVSFVEGFLRRLATGQ